MKYRLDSLAELARQMRFTPADVRAAQVAAAETLLHSIDVGKAYPIEFTIYRITGYRPKIAAGAALLTGVALQHDLGLLIEDVSDTLDLVAAQQSEPVLMIDDVTERFNVTSKSIQRWRRRGLPARRFTFPDGKRRVGFLLGSVERYIERSAGAQGNTRTNDGEIGQAERENILSRVGRLARAGLTIDEITRRVGGRLNRSPLTVLHTVRKSDANFDVADSNLADVNVSAERAAGSRCRDTFENAGDVVDDDERVRMTKAFRAGVPLGEVAALHGRPRATVYRVVLDERIARLGRRKIKFFDDPLYHHDDAAAAVESLAMAGSIGLAEHAGEKVTQASRPPRDLPPYLADLYRTPLLTPAQERALFLKMHFHRWQFISARRKLEPALADRRELEKLERPLRAATDTKNVIVRANLRLVVSIARKHLRAGMNVMELVSEGNVTLMRAVDSFDVHKGNRFSTYATLALMKGFARSVPAMQAGLRVGSLSSVHKVLRSSGAALHDLPDARRQSDVDHLVRRDEVATLLGRLDDAERDVVRARFGLGEQHAASFDEVAERLRLPTHRVRQLEQSAIRKLRRTALTR